jgi:hypothetical protein
VTKPTVYSCVACALCAALAACGSSSPKPSSKATAPGSNGHSIKLKFSECMRANGVPDFPDPSANGGSIADPSSSFEGIAIPSSINPQAPAFQAAERSCKQVLSGGSPSAPITEGEKLSALAQARCMRKHGVPSFPDPTFSSRAIGVDLGGVNPNSPAFKKAAKTCGSP